MTMSMFPARSQSTHSAETHAIKQTMMKGDYQEAALKVAAVTDSADARIVYEIVISYDAPTCWLALINNNNLNDNLSWEALQMLLIKADKLLDDTQPDPMLYKVALALAQNNNLRRKISYCNFIEYTKRNFLLAHFIAKDPNFMLHLDHKSIQEFIALCPEYTKDILANLLHLLTAEENNKNDMSEWIRNVLEWLVVHDHRVMAEVRKNQKFIALLKNSFLYRPLFAKQVLKDLVLCSMLKITTQSAIEHPRLSKDDFFEIGKHFQDSHLSLAMEYFFLATKRNHPYAAIALAYSVKIEDPNESWDWLRLAMGLLPAEDPVLTEALFYFQAFLCGTDNHELADTVSMQINLAYSQTTSTDTQDEANIEDDSNSADENVDSVSTSLDTLADRLANTLNVTDNANHDGEASSSESSSASQDYLPAYDSTQSVASAREHALQIRQNHYCHKILRKSKPHLF
ncbi:MAG: hypothetical protein BGO43_09860 [Gammaproteobacteria bacterium 39-13]|nr:hypothetical protein [Gammaproteobacteria bacterium]OJV89891.1 MAG: hypothetical protein BGO43_09860 [Gammaproteobacteria bacterium 39-13]